LLYIAFAAANFIAPPVIMKLKLKLTMMVASSQYTLYILSIALATQVDRESSIPSLLRSPNFITFIILLVSVTCGISAALLWVSQGIFISDCFSIIPEKRGLYTSIFFFGVQASNLSGFIANTILLQYTTIIPVLLIAAFVSMLS
jgi:MFS family permease